MYRIPPERILALLRIALYAALFTPFLFAGSFVFPFIVLKTHVFQALVGIIGALYAIWLLVDRTSPRPRWSPIRIAILGWFLAAFISSIFGVDLLRGLWSTAERGLGLVAAMHFMLFAFVLAEMRDHLPIKRYVSVSLGVSVVIALFVFVHIMDPVFFLEPPGGPTGFAGRPGSFLGNPTFLAAYLLPHIFLALWLAVASWSERRFGLAALYLGAIIASIVAIFLTQTRGALIGLVLGFVVFGFVLVLRYRSVHITKKLTVRTVGVAFLTLILIAGATFWFTRSSSFWQSVPGLRRLTALNLATKEIQPRLIAIRISVDAFLERPLLGHGFENFKYAFDRSYDPRLLEYGFGETYFDKPHNIFLEYLVNGGIVGLATYLAVFAALGFAVLRRKDGGFMAPAILGAVAAHLGNNAFVFDTFGSWIAIFLVLGVVDASWLSDRKSVPISSNSASVASSRGVRTWFLASGVFGFAVLWAVWNGSILYGNNRQYWILNYFLNRMPERAIASYHAGLDVPLNPFRNDIRRDFSSAVTQLVQEGIPIPDGAAVTREAIESMDVVVRARPHDYFPRVSYIDSAATLFPDDETIMARADQYLTEAFALSPKRQQIHFVEAKLRMAQASVQESQGRVREAQALMNDALRTMREAIDLDPEIAESHLDYALIAFEAEMADEGFLALETAERLGRVPRTGPELRIVANRYADAGNYPKAIALYNQALGMNTSDLESRLKLGIVYYYAGDIPAARAELEIVAQSTDLRQAPSYELLKPIFDAVGVPIP